MDIARQMHFFVRTVDEGSLSAAARSLELSPSTVSKQIRRLEDRLNVRLLNRSTRRVSLTDEGSELYQRFSRIIGELEEIEVLAASMAGQVQGTLRVNATVGFAKAQLLPLFALFLKRYPALELEIELTDRPIDLVEEGIDVAIRFTEQVTDTSVVARKLATNRRVICASPAYLEENGAPIAPEDLQRHNCLRLSNVAGWNDWEFSDENGRQVLQVRGKFVANSGDAVYHAALAGLGIARLSTYLVAGDLRSGRLVQLMPEYAHDRADILAIYPARRNLSPKVRALIDFLLEQLGTVPPWERESND